MNRALFAVHAVLEFRQTMFSSLKTFRFLLIFTALIVLVKCNAPSMNTVSTTARSLFCALNHTANLTVGRIRTTITNRKRRSLKWAIRLKSTNSKRRTSSYWAWNEYPIASTVTDPSASPSCWCTGCFWVPTRSLCQTNRWVSNPSTWARLETERFENGNCLKSDRYDTRTKRIRTFDVRLPAVNNNFSYFWLVCIIAIVFEHSGRT